MFEFNPHHNATSNGVVIEKGLMVTDYDRRTGWVIADRTSPILCENGWCNGDHWFEVEHADGTTKDFNGTRLLGRLSEVAR